MSVLFVEEANELLADAEQALLLLESLPDDPELLARVFRCAHTLKGNSKMLGYEDIATFTHQLENLLDCLRKGDLFVTHAVTDSLLASFDILKVLVGEVAGGPAHDRALCEAIRLRIEALVADLNADLVPRDAVADLEFSSADDVEAEVIVATRAAPAASVPCMIQSEPPMPPAPTVIEENVSTSSATVQAESPPVETSIGPAERLPPPGNNVAARERKAPAAEGESGSVRVPIDKLDRLINLTGEVVIAQSMIAQLVVDLTPEKIGMLQEVVAQMDRHCRELQERMLAARMLPIKSVFSRFNRIVRDLAASTGKSLQLDVSGEDTELDKNVIEKISDPLTHLVRNAIDHGVETTAQRRAAGKSETAKVQLAAYQKGGSIFIEVSDDGRGLDRDKILQKAIKLGLVKTDQSLTDDEIHALIFHPGFSTADQVTEISGRGVGMDVVKRNVQALKGSISIHTKRGEGTCFRVKLPLTLAILDGLGLRVGDQTYLVPLVSVVESVRPTAAEVSAIANVGEVVNVRGEYVPLIRLHDLFGVIPSHHAVHDGLVMVIDDGSQKIALQIDELIGQFQVVVKSLETNYQAVPGIAGGTILGDGRVALILDTGKLAVVAGDRARGRRAAKLQAAAAVVQANAQ